MSNIQIIIGSAGGLVPILHHQASMLTNVTFSSINPFDTHHNQITFQI